MSISNSPAQRNEHSGNIESDNECTSHVPSIQSVNTIVVSPLNSPDNSPTQAASIAESLHEARSDCSTSAPTEDWSFIPSFMLVQGGYPFVSERPPDWVSEVMDGDVGAMCLSPTDPQPVAVAFESDMRNELIVAPTRVCGCGLTFVDARWSHHMTSIRHGLWACRRHLQRMGQRGAVYHECHLVCS